MSESPEELFNLEQFKAELRQITEEYATASYYTYGKDHSPEKEAAQRQKAAELYQRLLDICANAVIATHGDEAIMTEIHRTVILYRYGCGIFLFFGTTLAAEFYCDLLRRVAEKS